MITAPRIEGRYIAEFTKMHPNVEIERVVNQASKIRDLVLTAFAARSGPDIFNLPIEQEYGYIVNQRVAPVDHRALGYRNVEELKADYAPNTFDPVTMKGKIYRLPLELTNWCVFINQRVFRNCQLESGEGLFKNLGGNGGYL